MKLVIVSNRLPIAIREEDGKLQFAESPGGLASGLRSYLNSPRRTPPSDYVWVGWPGGPVRPELQDEAARRCREEYSAFPRLPLCRGHGGLLRGLLQPHPLAPVPLLPQS